MNIVIGALLWWAYNFLQHYRTFYLYVNKQFVNTASDESYQSGEIGVAAASGDTGGTEAVFRNAQVWQLWRLYCKKSGREPTDVLDPSCSA